MSNHLNLASAWKVSCGLALLLVFSSEANAQTVFGTTSDVTNEVTTLETYQDPTQLANLPTVVLPAKPLPATKGPTPLRWGFIRAYPSLDYRFLNGNNILGQPGRNNNSSLQEITPGIFLALGDHWDLHYSPTIKYYTDKALRDSTDQSVDFSGKVAVKNWSLGLTQRFSSSSDALIETGRQTDRQNYSTTLSANRPYTERISVELSLNQQFQVAAGFSSSEEWSTMDWINYKVSEHITTGLGVHFGFDDVETGPDMTFEQLRGRIRWVPGTKLSVEANGGAEVRQFMDTDVSARLNPVFGVSFIYRPLEATELDLNGERAVRTSLLSNQVTENTDLSVTVRQRFLGKLFLEVTPGYRFTDYRNTLASSKLSRNDDTFFLSTQLSVTVLKKGRVSIFYQKNQNSSSDPRFDFHSDQAGFEIGYQL